MPLIHIENTLFLTIQENGHYFHTKKMHSLLGIDGTKDFPSETFDITFFFSIEHFGGRIHSCPINQLKKWEFKRGLACCLSN
jgi:hypothetical protein